MMDISTPICDFVNEYVDSAPLRLHMPGHKGKAASGNAAGENEIDCGLAAVAAENLDITEIDGADVLYHAKGIIKESEENAARIFGTARTIYSTEGSSLCIRAMLYLLQLYVDSHEHMNYSHRQYHDTDNTDVRENINADTGKSEKANPEEASQDACHEDEMPEGAVECISRKSSRMGMGRTAVIAAGRNAHKTFITCAGLLDIDVRWMYSHENSLVSCKLSPQDVEEFIEKEHPDAVYITSPDYLGNISDIAGISEVCHKRGCLLIVDNAHGAYLRFISHQDIDDSVSTCKKTTIYNKLSTKILSMHPIDLGADMCCDSAHKTLPVLTGGAYLHIADRAPELFKREAERAMSMFATTSPSYVIMHSLDRANYIMCSDYTFQIRKTADALSKLKKKLAEAGWELAGDEPLKLCLCPKAYGYTGAMIAEILRENGIYIEFYDPDYAVMMFTPSISEEDFAKLETVLSGIEKKSAIKEMPPSPVSGIPAINIKEALFSQCEEISIDKAEGRILAEPGVTCPPAVPIAICGEIIDRNVIECFRYYGINSVKVVE